MPSRSAEIYLTAYAYLANGETLELSSEVLSYSDQHTVSGIPTYSLSINPATPRGRRVLELVRPGDLIEVSLQAYTGKLGQWGEGTQVTTMIGIAQSVGTTEGLDEGSLTRRVSITGSSLGGFLMSEAINYFLALGTLEGYFRSLGLTPIDAISFTRLDAALAAYVRNVAFNALRIERPQGGIRDLLGYAIHTVNGIGLFDFMWANYGGSLWEFLQAYGEQPLHEIYQTILPASRAPMLRGFTSTAVRPFGLDQASPVLIVRPAPFPHGTLGGGVDLSAWQTLPLHDLSSSVRLEAVERNRERNAEGAVSFFSVYPKTLELDETMQLTWAPPIINDYKWRRWGYRPMSWASFLWGRDAAKEDAFEYFRELNWRVAGQHNRLDEMWSESLSVPLAPHVRVGERVRLPVRLGDETVHYQAYVEGVRHSYGSTAQSGTTLSLSRGLPEPLYQSGRWFTDRLVEYEPFRDAAITLETIREEERAGPIEED